MAQMRVAENVGFTVGTALAAGCLALPGNVGFLVLTFGNSASFILTAVAVAMLPSDAVPGPRTARLRATRALFSEKKWFVGTAAASGVLYLHTSVLTVGLPLWVTTQLRAPRWFVGVLLLLNTLLTIALQVRATRRTADINASGTALRDSGLVLAVSFALLAAADLVRHQSWAVASVLAVAVVALTAGELLHSAASWSLPVLAAREGEQARYFAVFNVGFAAHDVVGPVLVTWSITALGGSAWLLLALLVITAGVACRQLVPTVPPSQPAADACLQANDQPAAGAEKPSGAQ
jgi:hypothetical protein